MKNKSSDDINLRVVMTLT